MTSPHGNSVLSVVLRRQHDWKSPIASVHLSFWFVGIWWDLRFCILNISDDVAGSKATFWEPLSYGKEAVLTWRWFQKQNFKINVLVPIKILIKNTELHLGWCASFIKGIWHLWGCKRTLNMVVNLGKGFPSTVSLCFGNILNNLFWLQILCKSSYWWIQKFVFFLCKSNLPYLGSSVGEQSF
jgi:hypothetical protein